MMTGRSSGGARNKTRRGRSVRAFVQGLAGARVPSGRSAGNCGQVKTLGRSLAKGWAYLEAPLAPRTPAGDSQAVPYVNELGAQRVRLAELDL